MPVKIIILQNSLQAYNPSIKSKKISQTTIKESSLYMEV